MRFLSFDTSTEAIHLSLVENGIAQNEMVVAEKDAQTRQEAVAALMPSVVSLLADVGWKKSDIDCVVIGQGPGSFTGVRTGVVTGRSMAQGLHVGLVPVNLFECYATICTLPSAIVLASGRGRYFVAGFDSYDEKSGSFEISVEPTAISTAQLQETIGAYATWCLDEKALTELEAEREKLSAGSGSTAPTFKPLPILENIATRQAQLVGNRISLKLSETTASNGGKQSDAAESGSTEDSSLRESILQAYPYQPVAPLYLRNPSITLKKPAPSAEAKS
ncbi:MAG TPA: tRNA (adenosine(37)-N6)-threonylcarbamoyltransferase complex dimerization subunit type 1 TsaB [Drouetiella sp.]